MEFLDDLDRIIKYPKKKNKLNQYLFDKFPNGLCELNSYYAITHPWEIIKYVKRQLKYAWQRVFKGYDERVSWQLDYYLAKMIPLWISDIRHAKVPGVPMSFFDEYPHDENYNCSEEDEKKAEEKWHRILMEIEYGFQDYLKLDDLEFNDPERKNMEKRFEKAFDLLQEHWNELWW